MADKSAEPTTPSPRRKGLIDVKTLVIVILAIVTGLLLASKFGLIRSIGGPSEERTIAVSGEATLKETPDEFIFYPSYNFQNTDKKAALDELTKKSGEVTAKLKELGVPDKKIKTVTNEAGNYDIGSSDNPPTKRLSYSLQLTVTVDNSELAQKVQDYLVTTTPSGAVSPQASFSASKRKALEAKARDRAIAEARAKAEQTAKNLGFKLGKVKSVTDGAGFGIQPLEGRAEPAMAADSMTKQQLAVQPGENDIYYTVSVVYIIR